MARATARTWAKNTSKKPAQPRAVIRPNSHNQIVPAPTHWNRPDERKLALAHRAERPRHLSHVRCGPWRQGALGAAKAENEDLQSKVNLLEFNLGVAKAANEGLKSKVDLLELNEKNLQEAARHDSATISQTLRRASSWP